MKFYQIHTSGHAEIATLKKVVNKLKPGKIVPIQESVRGQVLKYNKSYIIFAA